MNFPQSILIHFVGPILGLLMFVMIIYMAFSWLIAFNIVNLRNPAMAQIHDLVRRIVEPILTPLRRIIPPMGGLDMAFLIAFLGLLWAKDWLVPTLARMLG